MDDLHCGFIDTVIRSESEWRVHTTQARFGAMQMLWGML
jgi:hypothetical protein